MKKLTLSLTLILVAASLAFAAIPTKINYQGVLKDSAGNAVNNPALSMVFSIYAGATGGSAIWFETQTPSVESGIYNVQLGDVTPIPADGSVFNGDTRYLGIKISPDTIEMSPRLPIVSVPYAYAAQLATTAESAAKIGSYSALVSGSGSFIPVTSSGKLDSSVMPNALTTTTTVAATRVENSSIYDNAEGLTGVITSTSPGSYSAGVRGINNGTDGNGIGVYGSQAGSGWGVYGSTPSGRGVYGTVDDIGAGVYGSTLGASGEGVHGYSYYKTGVYGQSTSANGVTAIGQVGLYATANLCAISAETTGAPAAITIQGVNAWGDNSAIAVKGYASGTGSFRNIGIYGESLGDNGRGVWGSINSSNGEGVIGEAQSGSANGIGVVGIQHNSSSGTHYGGFFSSDGSNGTGLYAAHVAASGMAPAIYAETMSTIAGAPAIYAKGQTAISAESPSESGNSTAITGILTHTTQGSYSAAVRGINNGTGGSGIGVWGSQAGTGYGIYGTVTGAGYPGYFDGGMGVKIPTTAGKPSTAPDPGTMVFDTSNNILFIYNSGWKGVTLEAF